MNLFNFKHFLANLRQSIVPDGKIKMIVNFFAGSVVVGVVINSFAVVEGRLSVVELGSKEVEVCSNDVGVVINCF